ncbi:MAG: DedA family protein [Acidimicrobiales bacterium]
MLSTVLALIPKWLDPQHLLETYGNWAVVAVIFAECGLFIGFFLPGDSLLFLAGFFSASSKFGIWPWWVLLPSLFVAAFVGDQCGYMLGTRIGPALFDKPDARIFKQKYVRMAHEYLEERGKIAIPLSRFVPVVRTFMPIVVGVSEIPYRTYALLDAIGAFVWAVGVTAIGVLVGTFTDKTINIDKYLLPVVAVVVLLSLLPVALEVRRKRRHGAAAAAEHSELP